MSQDAYKQYYGLWTKDPDGTWILTVDSFWSPILSAALVIWVAGVVATSWMPVKFIAHQSSTLERESPGFVEQLLVVIRNSSSPLQFAWVCTKMIYRWPGWSKLKWLLPLFVFSLVWFAAGTAAKLSVTLITSTAGQDVLVSPTHCGELLWSDPYSLTQDRLFRVNHMDEILTAQTRVNQCAGQGPDAKGCSGLPTTSINWKGFDALCPLKKKEDCITEDSEPFSMDSELIDSSTDLGMNAERGNSIKYRRLTTCSPFHLTDYASFLNINTTKYANRQIPNTTFQLFHLGPIKHLKYSFTDETFHYSEFEPYLPLAYQITTYQNEPGSLWIPNSTFWDRKDATISLLFLTSDHVGYEARVKDPWFHASRKYTVSFDGQVRTFYAPTEDVNAMACVDQHQICNPNVDGDDGCSPLTAFNLILSAASHPNLSLNKKQLATAERIASAIQASAMADVVDGRGGSALLAWKTLYGTIQVPLPVDQWRREMGNLFSIQLALLQQRIVDFAAGPRNSLLNHLVQKPPSPELQDQCKNQRVRLPGSQNFNMTGICIVASVGTFLIVIFLAFDKIAFAFQKFTGNWRSYARQTWTRHEASSLLADGDVEAGGEWEGRNDELPTSNDKLPPFDFTDEKNPRRISRRKFASMHLGNNEAQYEQDSGFVSNNGGVAPSQRSSRLPSVHRYEPVPPRALENLELGPMNGDHAIMH